MKGHIPLLLSLFAVELSAQSVRGRAVDDQQHAPISGALVELRDSTGAPIQRMLTPGSGVYFFAVPHAGRYSLRLAAIGFVPLTPVPIVVSDGLLAVPDLALTRAVFTLPDLVSAAKTRVCGAEELRRVSTFSDVLESAHTALQVVDAAFQGRTLAFRVRMINTTENFSPNRAVTADTVSSLITAWPVESADPDSLRTMGFAREPGPSELPGMIYYGPDARLLFADWFLDSHCFSLVFDKNGNGTDSVRMRFEPREKTPIVDLSGEMVFDRETMSLRRLEFRHVHLPSGIPEGTAGGWLTFDRWDSGLWLPTGWSIWGPIESVRYTAASPVRGIPTSMGPVAHRTVSGRAQMTGKVMEVVH